MARDLEHSREMLLEQSENYRVLAPWTRPTARD